jgi:hypothetical protein
MDGRMGWARTKCSRPSSDHVEIQRKPPRYAGALLVVVGKLVNPQEKAIAGWRNFLAEPPR